VEIQQLPLNSHYMGRVTSQWAKSPKKQSVVSVFLTIGHCILSVELTKEHSFRLFFWRFCLLG